MTEGEPVTATTQRPDRDTTRRLDGWLKSQGRAVRGPMSAAVGAGAVAALLAIAQAWLLARIIEAVAIRGLALSDIVPLALGLAAVIGLRALAAGVMPLAAFHAGARIRRDLRHRLQAQMTALGPDWARTQRSGDLANTLVDGVEALEAYYTGYLPQRLLAAFIPLAVLIAVLPADWLSALVLCVTGPLVPVFMILIGKGAEALNQRQWRTLARMSAHFFDAIEGLTTLKLFNASRREAEAVAAMSDAYRRHTMKVLRVAFLSSLVLEFLATLSIALVAVLIGFRLYYGEMSFLPGFFVLLLAPDFFRPLREMGTHYHARMAAIGAAEAIVACLDRALPEAGAGNPLAGPVTELRFDGVTYLHEGEAGQGVAGLTLALRRGDWVALVGPSGAGKTTLARLALGFLAPQAGAVRVNGADLATLDPEAWLARVAWVPQQPTLFHGTILDNIRLGRPDAPLEEVRAAAEAAGARAFIEALPAGFDTRLGDGGEGLSGGERRRVALARALLKPAELLILDEPTAALDAATTAQVMAALRARTRVAAVLLITHDAATAAAADRILRLEGGSLMADGPGDAQREAEAGQ